MGFSHYLSEPQQTRKSLLLVPDHHFAAHYLTLAAAFPQMTMRVFSRKFMTCLREMLHFFSVCSNFAWPWMPCRLGPGAPRNRRNAAFSQHVCAKLDRFLINRAFLEPPPSSPQAAPKQPPSQHRRNSPWPPGA